MSNKELLSMSITELAPRIEKREISPVELTEAQITQINDVDGQINAYITKTPELAIEYAKKAESEIMNGNYKGVLHGIPLAIKDNIHLKGVKSTHGSKIHNEIATETAPVVTKLLDSGMIPMGKVNLHEYALGVTTNNPHHGPTRNPWNTDKIVGGSSGGSAAALAANMAFAALGTDTGGSVRIPSACCGTVGLKGTFERVDKSGVFPLSWSLDHVGPMTRTVNDAALMFQAMVERSETFSKYDADLTGKLIGVPEQYFFGDEAVMEGINNTIETLKSLGAEVEFISIDAFAKAGYAGITIIGSEAATIHHNNLLERVEDFGGDISVLLKMGQLITAPQYLRVMQLRTLLIREMEEVFTKYDALLAPTIPLVAPDIGQSFVNIANQDMEVTGALIAFAALANVTGLPSLAVPSGLSQEGLPVGVQIIGKAFSEQTLLSIGNLLEQANPLRGNKPQFATTNLS